MRKIHYLHPKLGYHACGMGDRLTVEMTPNIKEVTCGHCQRTVAGKKRAGGRPNEGKEKLTVKIDEELKAKGKRLKVNFSQLLENAIRQLEE